MKAVVYYFTGTGNTEKVMRLISDELEKHNCEMTFVDVCSADVAQPYDYDIVCFAYPVHGFNTPLPLLDFVERLPTTPHEESKGYYVIKTSGEPLRLNSASSVKLIKRLQKKGYDFLGEFHYVMPYNIIFRHSDGMVSRMWQAAKCSAPRDALTMLEGKRLSLRLSPIYRLVTAIVAIEHPAMKVIGRGYRVNTKKCVNCGKCVKSCPLGNISVDNGRIKFGGKCVGCQRCAFTCPKDAIRIGVLNSWRVNGEYDFEKPVEDYYICRYCRKSYKRYFAEKGKEGKDLQKGKDCDNIDVR